MEAAILEGQRYHLATNGVAYHRLGTPRPHVLARFVLAIAASETGQARLTILDFIETYCTPRVYTQTDIETQDSHGQSTPTTIDNRNAGSLKSMRMEIARRSSAPCSSELRKETGELKLREPSGRPNSVAYTSADSERVRRQRRGKAPLRHGNVKSAI